MPPRCWPQGETRSDFAPAAHVWRPHAMSALDAASLPLGLRESHEKSSIDAPAQTRSTAEQKRQIAAGRTYGSHSRIRRVGRVRVSYGRLRFGAELSAFPQGGAD